MIFLFETVNRSPSASSIFRHQTPPRELQQQHQVLNNSNGNGRNGAATIDNEFVVHRSKGITTLFNMQEQLIPAKLRQPKEKTIHDSKADERGEHHTILENYSRFCSNFSHGFSFSHVFTFFIFFINPSSFRTPSQVMFPPVVQVIEKISEDRALPVCFILIASYHLGIFCFCFEDFQQIYRCCILSYQIALINSIFFTFRSSLSKKFFQ